MASKTITRGKRNSAMISTCFLLLFNLVAAASETTNVDEEACEYWKKMAAEISKTKSQMYCSANSTDPCTQLKCKGTYKYRSWIMPSFSSVEIDFCFGVVMNHCEDPVSLDIYLDVPNRNLSYQNRVIHDELLKIPGGSFQTSTVQKVEPFLHFHMLKNGSYVNFSMAIKLKLTALDNLTLWPRGLQRVLIPEEKIPVPPCETGRSVVSQPKPSPVCHPPHWRKNDDQSPMSDLIPMEKPSETYLRPCSDPHPCGETEVCNLKEGLCECYPEFEYDNITKVCRLKSYFGKQCDIHLSKTVCGFNEYCKQEETQADRKGVCKCIEHTAYDHLLQMCKYSTVDVAGNKNVVDKPKEKSSNAAAVAIWCLVVIIVVVAIIAGVFLYMRRKRRNFDRRVLLVNDDDDPLAM